MKTCFHYFRRGMTHKQPCSATDTSWNLDIFDVVYKQQIMDLTKLLTCAARLSDLLCCRLYVAKTDFLMS